MKNLEFNKILGALLFVAFIVVFASNVMDVIYETRIGHFDHNENLDISESLEGSSGDTGGISDNNSKLPKEFEILKLMEVADAGRGETTAKKVCSSCHSFGKDGQNRVGPNLYGVIGAKVGNKEGFNYSSALKNYDKIWSDGLLFKWINNPKKLIPGNKMAYAGVKKDQDIADLVAYLRTMHDNPPAIKE